MVHFVKMLFSFNGLKARGEMGIWEAGPKRYKIRKTTVTYRISSVMIQAALPGMWTTSILCFKVP
jgi:hypothetical protein